MVSNFCLIGKIHHNFLVPRMIELGCKTFMPIQTLDLHRVRKYVRGQRKKFSLWFTMSLCNPVNVQTYIHRAPSFGPKRSKNFLLEWPPITSGIYKRATFPIIITIGMLGEFWAHIFAPMCICYHTQKHTFCSYFIDCDCGFLHYILAPLCICYHAICNKYHSRFFVQVAHETIYEIIIFFYLPCHCQNQNYSGPLYSQYIDWLYKGP